MKLDSKQCALFHNHIKKKLFIAITKYNIVNIKQ